MRKIRARIREWWISVRIWFAGAALYWSLEEIFRRHPSLLFRVVFEGAMPTLAALVWGGKTFLGTGKWFDAITAAFIAFPLVLFVQGQILRMAKNVRDDRDADEFRDSFASLHQAVEAIRTQRAVETEPRQREYTPDPSGRMVPLGYNDFYYEASRALDSGQYFAAVLVAAVGFEHAAREAANQIGIDGHQRSLGRLIHELVRRSEDKERELLYTLLKLRNHFVHSDRDGPNIQQQQAIEFVNAFGRGIGILDNLG